MDTEAVNLMLWKHFSEEIRWAYSASPVSIALIVAAPGVDPLVVPMSDGLVEEYKKRVMLVESNGNIGAALEQCRERHRALGKTLPAAYFVLLNESGEWETDVMQVVFMSKGGDA